MRYSVRSLIIAVTAIGVALGSLVAAPSYVAVPLLVLINTALAACLTMGLIHGTGDLRAFCTGAMFAAGPTIVALTWLLCAWFLGGAWNVNKFQDLINYMERLAFTLRTWSGANWILCVVLGSISIATRRIVLRGKQPPGN